MGIFPAFYLLGLVTCVLSETCPSAEKISHCKCRTNSYRSNRIEVWCDDRTLTKKSLRVALDNLASNDYFRLELSHLTLGKIGSKFFNGTLIDELIIEDCKIDDLALGKPIFRGLENSLKLLEIKDSISNPVRLNIGYLRRLQVLELENVFLDGLELGNDWLPNPPPSLKKLLVGGLHVKIIGDKAFANMINLPDLEISGDKLGTIKRSMFPDPAEKLTSLRLKGYFSSHKDIPKDLFSNMPELEYLDMSSNGISRLDQQTWEPIWEQLETLILYGNPLECGPRLKWTYEYFPKTEKQLFGCCRYHQGRDCHNLSTFILKKGEGFSYKRI